MYRDSVVPAVPVGEWAARHDIPVSDKNAWRGRLPSDVLAESRKAYYAQITHIDAQIGRFVSKCKELGVGPTWFVFTSDHGEMLGDHHLFRKTYAYEGSARIPMIISSPDGVRQHMSDSPVSQQDIMPTILDAAGIDIPESVEGRSMLPLLSTSSDDAGWRDYVHGEHSACYHQDMAMQFLTDGKEKYIWYTRTGEEQIFNLIDDPNELHDLAEDPGSRDCLLLWRSRMVDELAPRIEDGLSDGKQLISGKTLPSVRDRKEPA